MPQPTTRLLLPQPCAESWDAMTPTSSGRHCATCQKTVIDFTWKTDAEILAFFAQSPGGSCGRFLTSQLARPLQPEVPARPTAPHWQGWLAAALTLWSLRVEATGAPRPARPLLSAQPLRRQPAPPPTRQLVGRVVRGVVFDAQRQAPLAQAKVRLNGTRRVATTDAHGYFRLWVPARRGPHRPQLLVVQRPGFATQTVRVPLAPRAAQALRIRLAYDVRGDVSDFFSLETLGGTPMLLVEEVVTPSPLAPASAGKADTAAAPMPPPRNWYQRLTRPFRPKSSR